jgi:hypothetical protein
VTDYHVSKLDYVISTFNTELSNDFSAYRNYTHQSQFSCKAYSDD